MKSVTFNLKVITPLFMGGAKHQAELRVQSFKGMIRFWWRALKSENDIKKLKEEEVKIFGGSIKKEDHKKNNSGSEEGIASKVKIVIKQNMVPSGSDLKSDFKLEYFFNKNTRSIDGKHGGINYLLYSTMLGNEQNRKFIRPDSTFSIQFCSRDENALKQTIAAFWCAVFLGGFGTRSRRGGGNLVVKSVEGETYGLSFLPKDDIANWLKGNLKTCFELIGSKPKNLCHAYPNLSINRVVVSNNNFNTWIEALNNIGNKFKEFRNKNKGKIFETAAFGLPIRHSQGGIINLVKELNNSREEKLRRASPIIIKVLEVNNNKYRWMVLRLAGRFQPENKQYKVKFNNEVKDVNYSLIDEFWNTIKNGNSEIILSIPKNIDDIKKKLVERGAKEVILFGSKARGDFKEKSDIDIAYVGDKTIFTQDINGNIDLVNLNKADDKLKKKITIEGLKL